VVSYRCTLKWSQLLAALRGCRARGLATDRCWRGNQQRGLLVHSGRFGSLTCALAPRMPFLTMPETSGHYAVGQLDCLWADGSTKLVVRHQPAAPPRAFCPAQDSRTCLKCAATQVRVFYPTDKEEAQSLPSARWLPERFGASRPASFPRPRPEGHFPRTARRVPSLRGDRRCCIPLSPCQFAEPIRPLSVSYAEAYAKFMWKPGDSPYAPTALSDPPAPRPDPPLTRSQSDGGV
jgi:hypothetical protein